MDEIKDLLDAYFMTADRDHKELLRAQEVSNLWALANSPLPNIPMEVKMQAASQAMALMGFKTLEQQQVHDTVEQLSSDLIL